jgi:hypothetical protein
MNVLAFYGGSAVNEWIGRAREADIVEVARRLQPRLRRVGIEWVGPCPSGCAREDGFAVAPRKRVFTCRPSGAGGDVIAMVMHSLACDFKDACAFIVGRGRPSPRVLPFNETLRRQRSCAERAASTERRGTVSDAPEEAERILKRNIAAGIWERSVPVSGSIGESSFVRRGLDPAAFHELRFHPCLEHWFGGGCMPAVVAQVTSGDGDFLGVHATFLTEDGGANKLLGNKRKLMLGGVRGGGVRFGLPPREEAYVVGEGIESTLSAMRLWGLSSGCAALSAPGLETLLLPVDVRRIVIAADNDINFRGQDAANRARHRWQTEGRQVRVRLPTAQGHDFNDLLLAKIERGTLS